MLLQAVFLFYVYVPVLHTIRINVFRSKYLFQIIKSGKLLAPNGTIVVDNALNYGTAYTDKESPVAKFDEHVLKEQSLHRVCVTFM